jgi:hypothetical protein
MASARAPLSATSCGLWQAVAHADRNPGPRGRRGGPGRLGIGARKPRPRVSRTRRRCAGSPRPMQRTKLSRAPTWATGQPRERPTWRRKTGNRPTQGAPNLATRNRQHTRVGSAPTWRCRTGSALGHVDPRRAALGTQSINALQRSASSRRDNHRVSDAGVLSRNAAPCVHHQRCMHARRPVDQSASVMVTDSMTTGVVGRSPAPVGTFCIRSTSSTPFTVWPKRL